MGRRCWFGLMALVFLVLWVGRGSGQEVGRPWEVLCEGMKGEDLEVCKDRCTELPASEECLFVRSFGAAGVRVFDLAKESGADVEEVALGQGFSREKASYLMMYLDYVRAIPHSWIRERGYSEEERQALERAERLNSESVKLFGQGRYQEGLNAAREALGIREKVLVSDHPDIATSLNNLGLLLKDMGDLSGARGYLERALRILEKVLPGDHPLIATSLNNLGFLLQAMGDLSGARGYLERALRILEKVLPAGHPDIAKSLNNLGGLLYDMGDLSGARGYYERALRIFEKVLPADHQYIAASLNNLGGLLYAMGDLSGARGYYERALRIREKVLPGDHPDIAASLNNLGSLLHAMGDLSGARGYYERALRILEKVLPGDHPLIATSLNNLGMLLKAMGDLSGARGYLERALRILEKVLPGDHPDIAKSLNNLGGLLQAMGDLSGARGYLERALRIREKVLPAGHPDIALSLNNLGMLLKAMGDLSGARGYYERALRIWEKVLGPGHPYTALGLSNLAVLEWEAGQLEKAKKRLSEAVRGYREHFQRNVDAAESDRQIYEFLKTVRPNFEAYLSLFASEGEEARVLEQVLSWQGAGTAAEKLWRDMRRAEGDATGEMKEKIGRYREARREWLRLMMAPVEKEEMRAEREKGLRALEEEIRVLEGELNKGSESFRRRREVMRATPEGVCEVLNKDKSSLVVYVQYNRYTPSKPQAERWTPRYLAMVVVPDGKGCNVKRIEPEEWTSEGIDRAVEGYRKGIEDVERCLGGGSNEAVCMTKMGAMEERAKELRAFVWDPVGKILPAGQRVYVVADGLLTQVSFGGLPVEGGKYLIEERELGMLLYPSQVIGLKYERRERGQGGLVVGNVDYRQGNDELKAMEVCDKKGCKLTERLISRVAAVMRGMEETKGSAVCHYEVRGWGSLGMGECGDVAKVLGKKEGEAVMVMGADASEGVVRRLLGGGFRYVHISTHGFSSPKECYEKESQVRSGMMLMGTGKSEPVVDELSLVGLIMAGANEKTKENARDDGILSGREVVDNADMRKSELVVLSACQTALGSLGTGGEGALGLAKAFEVAGAGTVIGSVWSVPDRPTTMLFTRFYEKYGEKVGDKRIDAITALREAQLSVLEWARSKGFTASSYIWSAFIPYGPR